MEEAEELDTSEEPLFLREPFMERMDLESASRSLGKKSSKCYQLILRPTLHNTFRDGLYRGAQNASSG